MGYLSLNQLIELHNDPNTTSAIQTFVPDSIRIRSDVTAVLKTVSLKQDQIDTLGISIPLLVSSLDGDQAECTIISDHLPEDASNIDPWTSGQIIAINSGPEVQAVMKTVEADFGLLKADFRARLVKSKVTFSGRKRNLKDDDMNEIILFVALQPPPPHLPLTVCLTISCPYHVAVINRR